MQRITGLVFGAAISIISATYMAPAVVHKPAVAPAAKHAHHKKTAHVPAKLAPIIVSTAKRFNLDPAILAAVAHRESAFDGSQCSKANACGIMQLIPSAAADHGVTDRSDDKASLEGGAAHLRRMLTRFNGNLGIALAAYNWGPENVDRWIAKGSPANGAPAETKKYVKDITGVSLTVWSGKVKDMRTLMANVSLDDYIAGARRDLHKID